MIQSRVTIATLLLSTALVTGACNSNTANDDGAKVLESDVVNEATFERLLNVKSDTSKSATAQAALEKTGLATSGSGALNWTSREEKNGAYHYTNVTATGDDGETVTIAEMDIQGPRMEGELATFDRMDMRGISYSEADGSGTIGRLSIARPSTKLGNAILSTVDRVARVQDLDDININLGDGDIEFGALLVDDVSVTHSDGVVTLEAMGWGEDAETEEGTFLLDGLSLNVDNENSNDPAVSIALGSVTGTGLNMNYFRNLSGNSTGRAGGNAGKGLNMFGLNPFTQQFENYTVKDLNVQADTFFIKSEGLEGGSRKSGDVMTVAQKINPIRIGFSDVPQNSDIMELQDMFATMGLEEIVISGESTSIMNEKDDSVEVRDSYLDVQDLMKLSYEYKATGLKAMTDKVKAQSEDGYEAQPNPLDMMSDMSLANFGLAITDKGLLDKIITLAAKEQGSTPKMLKTQAKGGLMMATLMAQNEGQAQLATDLSSAVGAFIDQGGTLNIKMTPASPVRIDRLSNLDPATFDPKDFGISVTHSK